MAQDDGQERTEQPTPKRLADAREKGQIARSRELTTTMVLMVAAFGLLFFGSSIVDSLTRLFETSFQLDRKSIFDPAMMYQHFIEALFEMLYMLIPYFVLVVFAALLAPLALGGWVFSIESMAFKPEKLDPIKGLGRLFGWKGLVELLKALGKFVVIATVGGFLLWFSMDEFLMLANEPIHQGMAHFLNIVIWSFIMIAASLILIAAVDVPFQLWDHTRQLKMTQQEIKDEFKQTEGSPELKGRIRRMQQEVAQRRMMQEVPTADVVITNPTHYAVALRYEQEGSGAPIVIAIGADLIALKIRSIATENHVPVIEMPPLARALYYSTDLGDEIPAGLYLAVAKILAYVYQIQVYQSHGGHRPPPPKEDDLPIPDDLKRDN